MPASLISRAPAFAMWALLVLCTGCGGGGSSSVSSDTSQSSSVGTFGATFSMASAEASGVEGSVQPLHLTATLLYTGTAGAYLSVDYDPALILGVQGDVSGNTLELSVTLRGDLSVGTHPGEIVLRACIDQSCAREVPGSPIHLPVQYVVGPNIRVSPAIALSRTGSEAAPVQSVPIVAPAEAGPLVLGVANSRPDAMAITFDGNQLSVQTRQVPAGTYGAKVTLSSPSDARYTRTVDIKYTVVPPTGGEHALSVANPVRTISVQQGQGSVQRLIVTRPTWTDVFDSPQVDDPSHILMLVDLGNDQYEASLASAGLAVGQSATATIMFSAGPTGGTTATRLTLSVTGAFYVDATQTRALTVTSTAADLDWTGRMLTFDGVPANWTAVSLSPWVQLTQASGKTGIDSLQFRINPAVLSSSDPLIFPIQLSIDRPGASPVTVPFSVTDQIPRLQQSSPSALVNTRGRIYVNGRFNADAGGLLSANRLHVTGATLVGAHLVADSRFAGDVVVLAVDVTDLIPDNSMTISIDSALVPSQVQLRVQAPLRAAAAYQALPYGAYRSAQFAVGSKALYFSGPGTAFRWAFDGSAWSLALSAVPGLIDVAMSPDESTLYASDPTHVISQDPITLALRSTRTLQGPPQSTTVFDKNPAAVGRAIVFSADGRAIGSISDVNFTDSHGVGWICDKLDYSNRIESAPGPCDPGVQQTPTLNTPVGFGLLRSANGDFIIGFGSHGERTVYQPETRAWVSGPTLPPGLSLVAASDTGTRLVRSDGMLLGPNDTQFGSLGSAVPFTHVVGGYGISSGGRFGFVYGYRLVGSGSTQTASEATLWVLDLSLASSVGVGSAPVIAAIPLPQAVGCTSPFANGETCQHSASISIAPGDGTAFILGPRGIVAVPLPAAVTPAAVTLTKPVVRAASRPTLWTPAAASQLQR